MAARIRDVADFPKPGVMFKDITPLLADHVAFAGLVDAVVNHYGRGEIDKVVGIEARGFILAAPSPTTPAPAWSRSESRADCPGRH